MKNTIYLASLSLYLAMTASAANATKLSCDWILHDQRSGSNLHLANAVQINSTGQDYAQIQTNWLGSTIAVSIDQNQIARISLILNNRSVAFTPNRTTYPVVIASTLSQPSTSAKFQFEMAGTAMNANCAIVP